MSKVYSYIRVSTAAQDTEIQSYENLKTANALRLTIDEEIKVTLSSRKSQEQRRIIELLESLNTGDTLIIAELSRLGRSTSEVILLVDFLLGRGVRVIVKKQNLDLKKNDMTTKIMITLLSLFAELERDMISQRTKEALAAKKAKGIPLGKPKGIIQASKFDADREQIEQLLKLGLSGRKIAKALKYDNPHGLNKYIRSRGLKDKSQSQ